MNYSKTPVAELRALAAEKGIVNAAEMKKKDLAMLLEKIDLMMQSKEETKQEETKPEVKNAEESKRPEAKKQRRPAKSVQPKENAEQPREEKPVREERQPKESVQQVQPVQEAEQDIDDEAEAPEKDYISDGILEILPEGYGFLRSDNYMPGARDIYLAPTQIRKFRLKTGDVISGPVKKNNSANDKYSGLLYIDKVNGISPEEVRNRIPFEDLTPIFPDERIHLDYDNAPRAIRIVDFFSPIGKGQRGMIVSPPKAGKTTLLKQIAKRITSAYPEMHLLVLLIDERPEEVTDIKEAIEGPNAEVIYSTFDELPEHHKRVSEMVIERAKRLVEIKKDVVILIDSITRLARAYNLTVTASGRTLSGGLDPAALHMPKKFFGAARNMREGGSLTILATALIETGSRMDDVVFEEFKGTGNMELVLDRSLSEKRIFPAINIPKSGTRRDDLLLDPEEKEALDLIHSNFRGNRTDEIVEELVKLFSQTKNNKEFIEMVKKIFKKY